MEKPLLSCAEDEQGIEKSKMNEIEYLAKRHLNWTDEEKQALEASWWEARAEKILWEEVERLIVREEATPRRQINFDSPNTGEKVTAATTTTTMTMTDGDKREIKDHMASAIDAKLESSLKKLDAIGDRLDKTVSSKMEETTRTLMGNFASLENKYSGMAQKQNALETRVMSELGTFRRQLEESSKGDPRTMTKEALEAKEEMKKMMVELKEIEEKEDVDPSEAKAASKHEMACLRNELRIKEDRASGHIGISAGWPSTTEHEEREKAVLAHTAKEGRGKADQPISSMSPYNGKTGVISPIMKFYCRNTTAKKNNLAKLRDRKSNLSVRDGKGELVRISVRPDYGPTTDAINCGMIAAAKAAEKILGGGKDARDRVKIMWDDWNVKVDNKVAAEVNVRGETHWWLPEFGPKSSA